MSLSQALIIKIELQQYSSTLKKPKFHPYPLNIRGPHHVFREYSLGMQMEHVDFSEL